MIRSALRRLRVLALLPLLAPLPGCGEFEPFEPVRLDGPLRFFGTGGGGVSVFLTEVASSDSTVRIELRARNVQRFTAVAFELTVDEEVVRIAEAEAGSFFQPGTPVVFELTPAQTTEPGRRWIGVVSLSRYTTDVSGGGVLASLVLRRTTDRPFDARVTFDPERTRLYGPQGEVLDDAAAVGGRLVFDPRSEGPAAP